MYNRLPVPGAPALNMRELQPYSPCRLLLALGSLALHQHYAGIMSEHDRQEIAFDSKKEQKMRYGWRPRLRLGRFQGRQGDNRASFVPVEICDLLCNAARNKVEEE